MDKQSQNINHHQLTISKTEQYLEPNKENDHLQFAFTINQVENLTTDITQAAISEWFYSQKIKKIKFINMILKVITLGCCNDLINRKTRIEVKPWLNKLQRLKATNNEEMLRSNQLINEAETIIIVNESKINAINSSVTRKNSSDEVFYDALDNQPWLNVKQINVSTEQQQTVVKKQLCRLTVKHI